MFFCPVRLVSNCHRSHVSTKFVYYPNIGIPVALSLSFISRHFHAMCANWCLFQEITLLPIFTSAMGYPNYEIVFVPYFMSRKGLEILSFSITRSSIASRDLPWCKYSEFSWSEPFYHCYSAWKSTQTLWLDAIFGKVSGAVLVWM